MHQKVERYTDQPSRLPEGIRVPKMEFYALADLDERMRLRFTWVILSDDGLLVASEEGAVLQEIPRSRIGKIRERTGLSCRILTICDREDDSALATLRFTQRQKRSMEALKARLQGEISHEVDPDQVYSELLLRDIEEAQALVAANRFKVVWRLLSYLKPYRGRLALGYLGAIGITGISLLPAFLTGKLIDETLGPFEKGLIPKEQAVHSAWMIFLALMGVYLGREPFAWLRFRMMSVLGEYVARDLRRDLYAHLNRLGMNFFSAKQTGSIISRVTSDSDRIWEFIAFGVVEVTVALMLLTGLGAVLVSLDWRLGLTLIAPVPFFLMAIYLHGQKMQRLFLRAWRKWSAVTDVLSDTIPGVRVVKAFHQEDQEKKRFFGRNDAVTAEFNRIHEAWNRFWPFQMAAIHSVMLVVWACALPRVLGVSGAPLSAGTFVSFLLYMTMFIQPIEVIGQMARMVNRATSSAHRIFELLDTQPQIADREDAVRLSPVRGAVRFENVSFSYDGIRSVLKGVSFEVSSGEMIGLVGPSGGGKTTLINLITRFYDVSSGRITVDGVDLRDLHSGQYRRQVGIVLQDPYLFHGTILENIRYGMPDATLEQVVAAASAANAHGFIGKLPHGYDTVVGERGHTLSGGERQRISIARAILHDPRILILDEATSAVDTETERNIQEALDRLVAGRTVFAIAHRLSTLRKADRILVIENGKLAEQGTHEELLARAEGTYRRLHRLQKELHESVAV